jgi:hypothetical protein
VYTKSTKKLSAICLQFGLQNKLVDEAKHGHEAFTQITWGASREPWRKVYLASRGLRRSGVPYNVHKCLGQRSFELLPALRELRVRLRLRAKSRVEQCVHVQLVCYWRSSRAITSEKFVRLSPATREFTPNTSVISSMSHRVKSFPRQTECCSQKRGRTKLHRAAFTMISSRERALLFLFIFNIFFSLPLRPSIFFLLIFQCAKL